VFQSDETRMAASLRLLSDASRILATSFDYVRTLGDVGRLVVPDLAAGFAVDIEDNDGPVRVVTIGTLAAAESRDLIAHGRFVGVMLVSGHAQDAVARDIFDEIAVRVAVAIDGARLYARESNVAGTLQRALLPDRLPASARLHFDAAYVPGEEEAFVGGDWYDAFVLPDGRIAISIGDVAGHGMRAAVIMGEVRHAVRAAALELGTPAAVLDRANAIVNLRVPPVMVTALVGTIDPETATLTYAVAGHPPPIIALSDGSVQRLPGGGIPLGIDDSVSAADWTLTLAPSTLAAFFTDGAIETTRDVIAGENRLVEAMHAENDERTAAPARALVRRILDGKKNADDIAILVATVSDDEPAEFDFSFTATATFVPYARRALQSFLRAHVRSEEAAFAVQTAVCEAMANCVEHAYPGDPGIALVRIALSPTQIVATIADDGRWKPAERSDERGRGLQLMRALMSSVEIKTEDGRTSVVLTLER
jgi:anti-sigma regulatory factor (Ser/Thr protein kinase)